MNIKLNYKKVSGLIAIPSSKSHSQRVYAAALLHHGTTIITNDGQSEDELAALRIIQQLGATVQQLGNHKNIVSKGHISPSASIIHCGESGLSARLFTPIAALAAQPISITGQGSLLHRPMDFFCNNLQALSVQLSHFGGQIPFTIQGPLIPQNIKVDGAISSQYISGLLFALSAAAKHSIVLEVTNLSSKPYIDLTIQVLTHFGRRINNDNYQRFTIDPKNFTHSPTIITRIESDWSSAAFWIAAAAINGSARLTGLNKHSLQADKKLLAIVQQIGAHTQWQANDLLVSHQELQATDTDLSHSPDLFPVLAILAACAHGTSKLHGLHRLIHKETNRAQAISNLLGLLGVYYAIEGDTLIIHGRSSFNTISYACPPDHRMAMAAALATMRSPGGIAISGAQCVAKSYPNFWTDVATHLGAI
ncbi:MAG: 3-phosphoshikimate 1-carboxyvinyltransferase [Chitinophagaceae bacterium]|nr:3-phosphoshikimate 1-carboxyvinyltransferase [Chitinophagaceae bacterium]